MRPQYRYILTDSEVPQLIGFERHIICKFPTLRAARFEARRRKLAGFVIFRLARRRDGSDGRVYCAGHVCAIGSSVPAR